MMKLFLVFSAAMVCWTIILVKADNWEEHQFKYPTKASKGTDEFQRRRNNFDKTDSRIQRHNKRSNSTFKMGHNQFSSMEDNEKKSFLSKITNIDQTKIIAADPPSLNTTLRQSLPMSVDHRCHRCMQPVRNQGECGACWSFAATAPIEFRKCYKSVNPPVSLSEQQLLDCTPNTIGCLGGHHITAWQYLINGQTTSALYPYTETKGTCRFNSSMAAAKLISPIIVFNFALNNTKDLIKSYLSNGYLVPLGFDVVSSFLNYQSGIFSDPSCKINALILGQHVATAVGYGTLNGVDYWILRNSWTAYWGIAGYVLFQRNVNMCNIEFYVTGTVDVQS